MPESNVPTPDPAYELKIQKLVEGHVLLKMTPRQAAFYAGFPPSQGAKLLREDPTALREIEELRSHVAEKYEVTKDRVIRGMLDAIERARVLGMPAAEMVGWKELGKMHGMYAPTEHRVHVSKDAARFERELQELPQHELLKIASGSGNWREADAVEAIDGEFVEVPRDET